MNKAVTKFWLSVLLLLVWEAAARMHWVSAWMIVPPTRIPAAVAGLIASGDLATHLAATLQRLTAAFVLGSGMGLALGLAGGLFRPLGQALEPLVNLLNSVPKLTLLPLAIAIAGTGEISRAMPPLLSSFAIMTVHALDSVRAVEPRYAELAASYGTSRLGMFRWVYLPSCLPRICTGIRLSLSIGLVMVVSVEMIGAHVGVGALIMLAGQVLATERLYAAVVVCGLLGLALTELLRWAERRLIPWES